MSFRKWMDEVEVFSSRFERAYGDVNGSDDPKVLLKWLETSYSQGYISGKQDALYELGKDY